MKATELLDVYQRALYTALTRADDDIPEWVYLNHKVGAAYVMDLDALRTTKGDDSGSSSESPTGDK